MGDYKRAIITLSQKKLIANQTVRNETLARIYSVTGDKDKAIEHLE
jgi:hypothetical protein